MALEFLMFWTRETLSNIRRNKLMSLVAISTVTIGLFILGAFYLAVKDVQALIGDQTQKLDLAIMLKPDVSEARRKEIYDAVHIAQVKKLVYVSKEQVLKEQVGDIPGYQVTDLMGDYNPLGDEFRVQLKNPEEFFKVLDYFKTIKDVTGVRTDGQVVHDLLAIKRVISVAGLASLCVLGMAILMIIHNSIRLTIFARRREIRIMELVGATPAFIRIPFLLEGLLYGLAGAALAMLALAALGRALSRVQLPMLQEMLLQPLANTDALSRCALWMVACGLVFGLLGSLLSLSRTLGKATHV